MSVACNSADPKLGATLLRAWYAAKMLPTSMAGGQVRTARSFDSTAVTDGSPIIHLLLSSVLGVAVLGLQPSFELLSVAINLGQLIIRELTSLLLALPESCFQFPCTR